MALVITPTISQLFTGVSTAGGYSFADLRNLGFFDDTEPVSLGSCFLDYNVGISSYPYDPVIGVSTYNVGVPSTGAISLLNLVGSVRELNIDISGSGSNVDLSSIVFGSEVTNNIRKNVAITTNCVITSINPSVAALRVPTGFNNLRLTVSGEIYGASGAPGFSTSVDTKDGSQGGTAIEVINVPTPGQSFVTGIILDVTSTGKVYGGGGGGGAGESGVSGSNAQYVCGSGCNGCQRSCRPGCCYDCGGGFNCCFDPCCSTYTNYCTAYGGSAGKGGAGGRGRGGDYPSGSLAGELGSSGGTGSGNGSTDGTAGGNGGTGGDYGKPGSSGSEAPSTGAGFTGFGGAAGYSIIGAYGFSQQPVGIFTGTISEPSFSFTSPGNATVGYAGTQPVWEFTTAGTTQFSLRKGQLVRMIMVAGGGNASGSTGGAAGGIEYKNNYYLKEGVWNLTVGSAGQPTTLIHNDGTNALTAATASGTTSGESHIIEYNPKTGSIVGITTTGGKLPGSGSSGAGGGGAGSAGNGYNGSQSTVNSLGTSIKGGLGGQALQFNVGINGIDEYGGGGGGGATGGGGCSAARIGNKGGNGSITTEGFSWNCNLGGASANTGGPYYQLCQNACKQAYGQSAYCISNCYKIPGEGGCGCTCYSIESSGFGFCQCCAANFSDSQSKWTSTGSYGNGATSGGSGASQGACIIRFLVGDL